MAYKRTIAQPTSVDIMIQGCHRAKFLCRSSGEQCECRCTALTMLEAGQVNFINLASSAFEHGYLAHLYHMWRIIGNNDFPCPQTCIVSNEEQCFEQQLVIMACCAMWDCLHESMEQWACYGQRSHAFTWRKASNRATWFDVIKERLCCLITVWQKSTKMFPCRRYWSWVDGCIEDSRICLKWVEIFLAEELVQWGLMLAASHIVLVRPECPMCEREDHISYFLYREYVRP